MDAWLERSAAKTLTRDELVDLFDAMLCALWARTSTTLGEVTLFAIADRVLHNAAQRHPAFASLRVEPNGRIYTRELRHTEAWVHHLKLLEGMRDLLVELLTVLGNLTAGLLTPELHAELSGAATNGNARRASPRLAAAGLPAKRSRANG